MPNMTFLPAALHRTQPWKNGLGVSTLIAEVPSGAGFDGVMWQVSVTGIGADCPFSNLPGLDRQFTVIQGDGVELVSVDESTGAESRQVVRPLRPYAFPGDWRTTCRLLGGPVRVLNVMTRRGCFAAAIEIRPADRAIQIEKVPGEALVAVALQSLDAWRLDGETTERRTVTPASDAEHIALVRFCRAS